MKKQPWIKYSEIELAWIKANCTLPRKEAYDKFRAKFGREDFGFKNFKGLCKRKGWKTGRTGRIEKGSVPPNKGKKMPYNANSARTQFKKGGRTGRANEVYKPIGTERVTKDGYIERKIHDGLPLQSRWRAVHLLNWEAINGKIPAKHCLKCLDGNKGNTDPKNWELIPRAALSFLNGKRGHNYDELPAEVRPAVITLAKVKVKKFELLNKGK